MYKQQYGTGGINKMTCPECKGARFTYSFTKLECTNCGWAEKQTPNKYGAKRTIAADGLKRDSKYEASVADELRLRKIGKDIKDYDSQFKVIMPIFNQHGRKVHEVSHKIDFCIHHNDGSYELLEAKGVETSDYKFRRKLLEKLWLPEHPDYTYTVVKQFKRGKK